MLNLALYCDNGDKEQAKAKGYVDFSQPKISKSNKNIHCQFVSTFSGHLTFILNSFHYTILKCNLFYLITDTTFYSLQLLSRLKLALLAQILAVYTNKYFDQT